MTSGILLIAGPAGAGKSTVGVEVARALGAVVLDLDTLTNPVLDALQARLAAVEPDGLHWNDASLADVIRPARYRALLDVAVAQRALHHRVVLVAPFTAELAGGAAWEHLVEVLGVAPTVVWLDVPEAERARRLVDRGEGRDVGRAPSSGPAPAVPHLRVDASAPPADVVERALAAVRR
ncbi:AAA family ATPase [Aeromicrobium sp. CTD01-1L150]|uniref:AAA family ATPase n=1 Tax=Aeromicrobium sp. CTD01-1L150 TaxID=3341830 RepID=UPI0035C09F85